MRVGMLLALPLPYWKATPVTLKPVKTTWKQTQNQAHKETDIKLCWFLLLLNSGRTELGCTTQIIPFSVKITCTTLLSPSYCIKQAPSDTKRGGLLMPQLRDGAYINHVTSNFLNAWKSSSQNEKKTAHAMCRSISFSESKHRNELFFFLQKNMMQGFFHWVKTKRKKKTRKTHSKSTVLKLSVLTSFQCALKL